MSRSNLYSNICRNYNKTHYNKTSSKILSSNKEWRSIHLNRQSQRKTKLIMSSKFQFKQIKKHMTKIKTGWKGKYPNIQENTNIS